MYRREHLSSLKAKCPVRTIIHSRRVPDQDTSSQLDLFILNNIDDFSTKLDMTNVFGLLYGNDIMSSYEDECIR